MNTSRSTDPKTVERLLRVKFGGIALLILVTGISVALILGKIGTGIIDGVVGLPLGLAAIVYFIAKFTQRET